MSNLRKESVRVQVDGEWISQEVYVDEDTGLDVDPNTGKFRTREDSEELIAEVYRIGRVSLGKELERYNKWVKKGAIGDEDKGLFTKTTAGLVGQSPGTNRDSANSHSASHSKKEDTKSERDRAIEFKELGNAALSKHDCRKAVRLYTRGLRCDPSLAVLWSNRAEAHLRLHRYTNALDDARKASNLEGRSGLSIKALYREATALSALGRIEECRSIAQSVLEDADNTFLSRMTPADMNAWTTLRDTGSSSTNHGLALCANHIWRAAADIAAGDVVGYLPVVCLPGTTFSGVLESWGSRSGPNVPQSEKEEGGAGLLNASLIDPSVLHALQQYEKMRSTGVSQDLDSQLPFLPLAPSAALHALHTEIMCYCQQKRECSVGTDDSSQSQTAAEWVAASSSLSEEYRYLIVLACMLGEDGIVNSAGSRNLWVELPLNRLIDSPGKPTGGTPSITTGVAEQHFFALGSGLLLLEKSKMDASLDDPLSCDTCERNVILERTESNGCAIRALSRLARGDKLVLNVA